MALIMSSSPTLFGNTQSQRPLPGSFDGFSGDAGHGLGFNSSQSSSASGQGQSAAFDFSPSPTTAPTQQPTSQLLPQHVQSPHTSSAPSPEELVLQNTRQKLAQYVDNLVTGYGLSEENRKELLNFCWLFSIAVDRHTIMLHAVRFAKDFRLERRLDAMEESMKKISAGLADISSQVNVNYCLPPQATKNIRALAMQLIAQADRVRFMDLSDSVLEELQKPETASNFGLENVFETPVRRQTLEAAVRRICSSVRNGLRQDIRDCLGFGQKAMGAAKGLVAFATHMANKYRPDDASNIVLSVSSRFTIKMAILRAFAVENRDLLAVREDEDQQADAVARGEKRKAGSAGRIKKGSDFWSLVEGHLAWLSIMHGEGNFDFMKQSWDAFVKETVQQDMTRIPSSSNTAAPLSSAAAAHRPRAAGLSPPAPQGMPFTDMVGLLMN